MKTIILGISAFYHDSAAALVLDGRIVAAAQEERFTRKKHDADFPANAIRCCLEQANVEISEVTHIVFYDKPILKFERLLETYISYAPRGFRSFLAAMPVWLKQKLFLKTLLRKEFEGLGISKKQFPKLLFTEHHQAHAASAFFPSPYKKAAVLCLDGVGEWAATSVWVGEGNRLTPQWEIQFPHSLGLLYSAFTFYIGFKVNSGEYKLMGLAPYGQPKYVDLILDNLIDIKEDGTFRLDMKYFNFAAGLTMISQRFESVFGHPARKSESDLTQFHMDIARSIQVVTEDIVVKLAKSIRREFDIDYLCLAGGVALNCVANGKLQKDSGFKDVWVQPAAGDAGSSLGAALSCWYEYLDNDRTVNSKDSMEGGFLGCEYSDKEVSTYLTKSGAKFESISDDILFPELAKDIDSGMVVGWFQGRMEFGPRSLGGRSIIGDPRSKVMQLQLNLKIKFRESFRPFAPAVMANKSSDWFESEKESPYMLFVTDIHKSKCLEVEEKENLFGIDRLKVPRSLLPAVTHVDGSARYQTVHKDTNARFYELLNAFDQLTGCPVLVNTSFNVRGEPIVCSPEDALSCFMNTGMDVLVIENCVVRKKDQDQDLIDRMKRTEFELD